MRTVRITKEFAFEMAHALWGHDGPCKNIHGHSYQFAVTLIGTPIDQEGHPKEGMVMDFRDLKALINQEIIHPFDHALVLPDNTHPVVLASLDNQKLLVTPFAPTCENLISYFAQKIMGQLPPHIKLHHLILRETKTSYAEWYATDNE